MCEELCEYLSAVVVEEEVVRCFEWLCGMCKVVECINDRVWRARAECVEYCTHESCVFVFACVAVVCEVFVRVVYHCACLLFDACKGSF